MRWFLLALSVVVTRAVKQFEVWRTGLPVDGFQHHAIAVNKRDWPATAEFAPDALLSALAGPLQKGAPGDKFKLYLMDTATTASSSSSVAWPAGAVAVVFTTYSGYLPYVHGLANDSNATSSALALARFAALAVSVGDPSGVTSVRSGDELLDLIDTVDPPRPAMVLFTAFASPHSVRARPFFEAAAALYGRQLPFAEVRCAGRGSNEALAALCRKLGVAALPTLGLYTGEEWIPFDVAGSARSPGDIELFLWRHRRRFPHAMQALEAALPIALPAAAASAAAASAAVTAPTQAVAPAQPSSPGAPPSPQSQPQPQPGLTFSLEEVGRMIAAAVGEVKTQLQAEQAARARAECLLAKAEARERQLQAQLRVGQAGAGDAEILARQC